MCFPKTFLMHRLFEQTQKYSDFRRQKENKTQYHGHIYHIRILMCKNILCVNNFFSFSFKFEKPLCLCGVYFVMLKKC